MSAPVIPIRSSDGRSPLACELTREVGSRIAATRDRLGLTQHDLSHRSGIDRSTLGHIEIGRQRITVEHLYRIAVAMACQPGDLLPSVQQIAQLVPSLRQQASSLPV